MTTLIRFLYLALLACFVGGTVAAQDQTGKVASLPRDVHPFSNGIAPCGPTPANSSGAVLRQPGLTYGTTRYLGNLTRLPGFIVADINKDGVPDLIAAQFGESSIAISLGDPVHRGTFLDPIFVAVPTSTPYGVTVADLNGDGYPDIVYTDDYNSASILFQDALHPGTFKAATYLGASEPSAIVADMNHDGVPDIILFPALHAVGTDAVSILLGDPGRPGFFLPPSVFPLLQGDIWVGAVGDINRDNLPDLVVASYASRTVSVFLNDTAHPGSLLPRRDYPNIAFTYDLALGDLNGDGLPDVVLGGISSGVCVLLNDAAHPGTLLPVTAYATTATAHNGGESYAIALGDVNGDGKLDAVSGNEGPVFDLFLGNGDGTFAAAKPYPTGPTPDTFAALHVAIADVDGDGLQDVLVGQIGQDNIQIFTHQPVTPSLAITATDQTLTRYAGVSGDTTKIDIKVTAFQGIPQGTVTLFDSGGGPTYARIATLPLDNTGAAVYTTPTPGGSHGFISHFPGDSFYAPSTSLIDKTSAPSLVLSLTATPNPAAPGQNVTFDATMPAIVPPPIGNIVFSDDGAVLGSVSVSSTGTTIFNTSSLTPGTHTITASYSGDTQYAPRQASTTETIRYPAAQLTLASSLNPATAGQPVTFQAKATVSGPAPTGTLTFRDNGASLAQLPLAADATAAYTTSTLAVGTHLILATYSGDGNYDTQSTTLTEIVVAPPAPPPPPPPPIEPGDFTLGTDSPLTLGTRRVGTSTLIVTPLNGLADTVALSCGALPLYTTCKIAPSTAAVSGVTARQATIQIAVDQSPAYAGLRARTTLLLAAAFPLLFCGVPRVRLRKRLAIFVLLPLIGGGCGFSKSPLSTSPGTYSIVIAGHGATSHLDRSTTLTLIVR